MSDLWIGVIVDRNTGAGPLGRFSGVQERTGVRQDTSQSVLRIYNFNRDVI